MNIKSLKFCYYNNYHNYFTTSNIVGSILSITVIVVGNGIGNQNLKILGKAVSLQAYVFEKDLNLSVLPPTISKY